MSENEQIPMQNVASNDAGINQQSSTTSNPNVEGYYPDINTGIWSCPTLTSLEKVMINCVIIAWNVFLVVLLLVAFSLSIYGIVTSRSGVRKRELLDEAHTSLRDLYNVPNPSTESAKQMVQNVDTNIKLYLYTGCNETISECTVNHTEVTAMPSSVTCDTPMRPLTMAGVTNTDIYCSIDNTLGETNPIVATLSINEFGGHIKCVCSLLALSNPTGDVGCKLHVRRCPDTIQLI